MPFCYALTVLSLVVAENFDLLGAGSQDDGGAHIEELRAKLDESSNCS